MHYTKRLPLLFAAIILALPIAAFAGGNATIVTTSEGIRAGGTSFGKGDSTLHIDWRDAHTLRMDIQGENSYFLFRDGKAYSVSQEGGQTRVIDMKSMMGMMHAMGGKSQQHNDHPAHIDSIQDTGRTETVAGIKGRVYHMTWTQDDGTTKSADAVLTGNAMVTEMTRAFTESTAAMTGNKQQSQAFVRGLPQGERGMLRIGHSYRVKSINSNTPPASRFKLPAKPMDMSRMFQGMGKP